MDQQITIDSPKKVVLDDQDQKRVVNFVKTTHQKGLDARQPYDADRKQCEKMYHCVPELYNDAEMDWQSNHCLPWGYDTVESWVAYLHDTMIPQNDKTFVIQGRNDSDEPGAEVMEKYMAYRMARMKFRQKFKKVLRMLGIQNHACIKVKWRTDKRIGHDWQPVYDADPTTGQMVQTGKTKVEQEYIVYNNVDFDVIDLDNFSFFPIHGDFNKTTRVHTTYRFLEELKEAAEKNEAPYFNINKITADEGEREAYPPGYSPAGDSPTGDYPKPSSLTSLNDVVNNETEYRGLKIREAWISRIRVGENADGTPRIFRNYVATTVNDKYLIRFEPNPHDMGESPFIWIPLMPDGANCLCGYGLLSKGVPLLKAANFTFNQRLNEIKVKLYGSYKYYDDGVFNPYNVLSRPGAMIPMADGQSVSENLQPLNPNLQHLQIAYDEVEFLKNEFEEVTVPKVVKGMIDEHNQTATEATYAQNNASGKMNVQACSINDDGLQLILERMYALIYQAIHPGDDGQIREPDVLLEIAKITQDATQKLDKDPNGQPLPPDQHQEMQLSDEQIVAKLPQFLPLPEVDVKIIGYQNSMMKQQTAQAMGQVVPALAQSPAAKYLKWYGIAETSFRMADLNKDELLCTDKEREAIDAQPQPPDPKMLELQGKQQAEQARSQNDQMKLQIDGLIAQGKARDAQIANDLKALELELKYGLQSVQLATSIQHAQAGIEQAQQTIDNSAKQAETAERGASPAGDKAA